MNQLGITLLWCIAQVTLLSLSAGGAYVLLRRFGPRAGALVIMTSMMLIVGLSLMMFSPWPRWTPLADSRQAPTPRTPADRSVASVSLQAETDATVSTPGPTTIAEGRAEVEPVNQSSASLFLQALQHELSQPRPATETTAARWPVALVALMSAGLLLGLARLAAGLVAVVRYRRQSQIIEDPRLTEMADILLAELGCRRRPELRESDALRSAATVGWRHPLILLPRQWRDWSEEQLHAVLAHELAHVRANDFLTGLLGQIGLALHFYHPLVHWLMGRLRLEQELAADSVAAGLSGGRRSYLTTIAAMAIEQDDQNVGWPARAFLPAKSTFLRRISMLRNSRFRIAPISFGVRVTSIAVMLLLGLAIAGLRPGTTDRVVAQQPAETAEAAEVTAPPEEIPIGELDLAYVPEDALLVIAWRPAEVVARMKRLGLYELAAEGGFPGIVKGDELTEMSMLEQHTMAVCQSGSESEMNYDYVIVFRFTKPIQGDLTKPAQGDQFAELRMEGAETTYRRKTYHVATHSASLTPYRTAYQADDRTFVNIRSTHSGESRIRRLIEAGPDSRPAFEQEPAWQAVKQGQVAVLINDPRQHAHILTDVLPDGSRAMTPQEAFASSFLTLVKDVDVISAGVQWNEELSAQAFALCKNQQATDDLTNLLEGAEVLGRAWMLAPSATANGNPEVLDIVGELFEALEIRKRGLRVQVQTSIPVDRDWAETFAGEIITARQVAKRSMSSNNLKQLALAMHNYHHIYKCFPPPVLLGPDGKTPYSWRVALLPYLDQQALYDAYDFDEPWDGPNNRKLLESMPAVFRHPTLQGATTTSAYYALTGPETVFDGNKDRGNNRGVGFKDIRDGTSNTLMFVEAKRDIPWTKPADIPYDVDKRLPELGGFFEAGFYAATCDGAVHLWPADIDEDLLRAMISKDGREVIDFETMTVR